MRMFLVCITDIFLLLYLTAIANVKPATVLTIGDFYKLKAMHNELALEKEATEEQYRDKLLREQEEKDKLSAKLDEERTRLDDMQKTLIDSVSEREKINQDLRHKEEMLKAREDMLNDLNQQIAAKEADWEQVRNTFVEELETQKAAVEVTRQHAAQLAEEAKDAQLLADQMQVEADQAYETADMAQAVKERALRLQVKALEEKMEAERQAAEAQAAKEAAEKERQAALKDKEEAEANKRIAERKARMLASTIEEIKQDGDTAYQENIHPRLQTLSVSWKREIADNDTVYERELNLLPVTINGKVYAIFPSRQIGFTGRTDKIPNSLIIKFGKQRIHTALFDKEDDLLAIVLPGYKGKSVEPHAKDLPLTELMPALLALRNNGNVSLQDKLRGISGDYFIVNRDYLELEEDGAMKFSVSGFRGTGVRAERIVRGDQLVDLNGRLIGVANTANHIVRIDHFKDWEEIKF